MVVPLKCSVGSLGKATPVENVNPAYVNPCRAATLTLSLHQTQPTVSSGPKPRSSALEGRAAEKTRSGLEACRLRPSPPTPVTVYFRAQAGAL